MIVGQSDELCYDATSSEPELHKLGQAIGPLWDFCAPISIVVEL